MTLDEIIEALSEDVDDEGADYEKYTKLAEALKEKFPNRGYGGIIMDIAWEEKTHHDHIKHILTDMGADEEEPAENEKIA